MQSWHEKCYFPTTAKLEMGFQILRMYSPIYTQKAPLMTNNVIGAV